MKQPTQAGSGIHSDCAQEVLDSASNASDRGQGAFETPRSFGELVCIPLPDTRTNIVDWNAGSGQLLFAAANATTRNLLGADIDPRQSAKLETDKLSITRMTGDCTKLFPLFTEVGWQFDLGVFNPPFSMKWYRDRLTELGESPLYTVSTAFRGRDPLCGKDTIDSTPATIMMALHLMSQRGEAALIANQATLERLIFNPNAPHGALKSHIWGNIAIAGNPMTGDKGDNFTEEFRTGVIYFAKGHSTGCRLRTEVEDLEQFRDEAKRFFNLRPQHRRGSELLYEHNVNPDTVRLFTAVRDEWAIREGKKGSYNIFLNHDGTIGTYLSLFERTSFKVDKGEVGKLAALAGERPMSLVLQSATRQALERAVNGTLWRVAPDLPAQVQDAIRQYNAVRAPLTKLNPIQSLGYADDLEELECKATQMRGTKRIFIAGKRYKLSSKAVKVQRTKYKPNLSFGTDEMLMDGRELLITITGEDRAYNFMDARHCAPGVTIDDKVTVDFHLPHLVEFFHVPVPECVSECNPDGFNYNMEKIDEIEQLINEVTNA